MVAPTNITNRAFRVKAAPKTDGELVVFIWNELLSPFSDQIGQFWHNSARCSRLDETSEQEEESFRAALASRMHVSECIRQPVQTAAQLFAVPRCLVSLPLSALQKQLWRSRDNS